MNIVICGYEHTENGLKEIEELQQFLQNNGYDIVRTGDCGLSGLSFNQLIEEELERLGKADVMVLILQSSSSGLDVGSAVKAYKFAMDTKPVIIYNQNEANPELDLWSTLVGRKVCKSKQELLESIEELGRSRTIGVIPNVHGDHEAEFEYKDFECICPVTGERDKATIKITYAPHQWLVEYESLYSYFKQFANRRIHHEGVVNEIFHQLNHTIQPKWIKVVAEFEPRSGIKATVEKRSK